MIKITSINNNQKYLKDHYSLERLLRQPHLTPRTDSCIIYISRCGVHNTNTIEFNCLIPTNLANSDIK